MWVMFLASEEYFSIFQSPLEGRHQLGWKTMPTSRGEGVVVGVPSRVHPCACECELGRGGGSGLGVLIGWGWRVVVLVWRLLDGARDGGGTGLGRQLCRPLVGKA